MAKQQSEACPFRSRFSDEPLWLTPAQYLAENMVARTARKQGTDLPHRFWETEKWKRTFLLQLRYANSLLKLYEVDAVVRALRTKKGQTVYSLGAQFILDSLIKSEQEKLTRQRQAAAVKAQAEPKPEPAPEPQPTEPAAQPRPAFVGKTMLSKLKGL